MSDKKKLVIQAFEKMKFYKVRGGVNTAYIHCYDEVVASDMFSKRYGNEDVMIVEELDPLEFYGYIKSQARPSCTKSCVPLDYCKGGKCDRNGCFTE